MPWDTGLCLERYSVEKFGNCWSDDDLSLILPMIKSVLLKYIFCLYPSDRAV